MFTPGGWYQLKFDRYTSKGNRLKLLGAQPAPADPRMKVALIEHKANLHTRVQRVGMNLMCEYGEIAMLSLAETLESRKMEPGGPGCLAWVCPCYCADSGGSFAKTKFILTRVITDGYGGVEEQPASRHHPKRTLPLPLSVQEKATFRLGELLRNKAVVQDYDNGTVGLLVTFEVQSGEGMHVGRRYTDDVR